MYVIMSYFDKSYLPTIITKAYMYLLVRNASYIKTRKTKFYL